MSRCKNIERVQPIITYKTCSPLYCLIAQTYKYKFYRLVHFVILLIIYLMSQKFNLFMSTVNSEILLFSHIYFFKQTIGKNAYWDTAMF